MAEASSPATLVATRVVPVYAAEAFDRWADAMERSAASASGGGGSVRLEQAGGLVHLVHRFASAEALDAWTGSEEYRDLLAAAGRFPVERRQQASGRVVRFAIPAESAASKLKSFVLTWASVFPVLLVSTTVTRTLAGGLPQPVQLLLSTPIVVALLNWVILPRVQRALRPWTLADAQGEARR